MAEPGGHRGGAPEEREKHAYFSALPRNSNNAFVAGSSGLPRSSLILACVVSLAAKTVAGRPASFSTLPRRSARAVLSGWPATCTIRNGGTPLPFAAWVPAAHT